MAQRLWELRDRAVVVPFDTLELAPSRNTVVEGLPGATLRLPGLPYAIRHGDVTDASATDITAERTTTLSSLTGALAAYGVRVEVPPHVASVCAQDAGDAVLALVTVYLATRGHWTPPLSGVAASRALVESWIVRPG